MKIQKDSPEEMEKILDAIDKIKEILRRPFHCHESEETQQEYKHYRAILTRNSYAIDDKVPDFLRECTILTEFQSYILGFDRTVYVRDKFYPLVYFIENTINKNLYLQPITHNFSKLGEEHINESWGKALACLKKGDTAETITKAAAVLESIIKNVFLKLGIVCNEKDRLSTLQGKLKQLSGFLPNNPNATRQELESILEDSSNIVAKLSSMRNALGNAHGSGVATDMPPLMYAELVIHQVGTVGSFLISTWESYPEKAIQGSAVSLTEEDD